MPDRIILTGDFDSSEIVKGVNGMIDALKRAQSQQDNTKASMESAQEVADGSAEGIKKLTAQIAALDKTNKDYAATNLQLTGRLNALKDQYDKYTATIEKQRKELDLSQATITKMTAAYDAAKKSVTELQATAGKPIAPAMNDGKLTASIGGIKDKMKDVVQNINTAAPAIDNVAGSVEGLGSSFGPMGIAASLALGAIAKELYKMATAETDAERATKLLNEGLRANASASAEASGDVEILKVKFELASQGLLSQKEVLDEYNKTLGTTLGVTNDFNEAEQRLIDNADVYIRIVGLKAEAQALANLRVKKSEEKAETDLNLVDKTNNVTKVVQGLSAFNLLTGFDPAKYAANKANDRQRFNAASSLENQKDIDVISTKEVELQRQIAALSLPFKDLPKTFGSTASKGRKEIADIYEQELQKLRADIAKINEKGFMDEASITAAVEADFKKRDLAFQKAFKNKQLTSGELESLQGNLKNLQELVLAKSLKDFATQKAAYLKQIDDQLSALQNDIDLKRISNIQDSFTRERLTIEAETDKTIAALGARRDKQIADLNRNAAKNGIGKAELQSQVDVVTATYSDMLDTINAIKNQKLQKLSFDTFEKLSEDARRILDSGNLGVSQGTLIKIQDLTGQYQAGKLSYAKYQKELTEIARFEAQERFSLQKLFLEAEIKIRQDKLLSDKALTDDQVKRLQDEIRRLQQQLSDATRGNITQGVANGKSDSDKKIQDLLNYANAIKSVTDSVISFWQQANEAEQRSLDRSIALQDRRVEAARNVAAKGNAEYLRMEEERDQELLIRKENAARRQMAINAAIQASSLLVAVTGAVAKIAEPGVGAVDVIASIGVIIGSLAAGYALVKSLQQNQPSFYVGTEDTGKGGNVDEKGGFHAVLHPHERVLTAEENKKLRGLSNKEVIERVTENYKVKPAPSLNLAAMEAATNSGARQEAMRLDGMEKRLDENNHLQKRILQTLKGLGISFNWDERGASLSILKTLDEIDKSKKS